MNRHDFRLWNTAGGTAGNACYIAGMNAVVGIPEPHRNPLDGPGNVAGGQPERLDTSLILCVACGLIVNSHLEQFWPRSFFACDGLLGNSLFYMLSGFGVGSSLLSSWQPFGSFLARRLARIYPAVIVTVLLFTGVVAGHAYRTVNGVPPWTLAEAFRLLVWPTPFTYVSNIIAIYVIGYVVALPRSLSILYAGFAGAFVLFLWGCTQQSPVFASQRHLNLGSAPTLAYHFFDTALFLGGMIIAGTRPGYRRPGGADGAGGILAAVLAAVLCIAYFALKYAMIVEGKGAEFYPVLFVLAGGVSYLAIGVLGNPLVIQWCKRTPWLAWVIDGVAGLTLEIYVIHQTLIGTFAGLAAIPFPLNIVLLVVITLAAAVLLRMITQPLRRWVDELTRPAATPA